MTILRFFVAAVEGVGLGVFCGWATSMYPVGVLAGCVWVIAYDLICYVTADDMQPTPAQRDAMLAEGWRQLQHPDGRPYMVWHGSENHPDVEDELPHKRPVWDNEIGAPE